MSSPAGPRSPGPIRPHLRTACISPGWSGRWRWHESGARPLVVLTKADLDNGTARDDLRTRLVGADVLAVSARRGTGLGQLPGVLAPGTTGALVGPSGAGKPTLVNALVGQPLLLPARVGARLRRADGDPLGRSGRRPTGQLPQARTRNGGRTPALGPAGGARGPARLAPPGQDRSAPGNAPAVVTALDRTVGRGQSGGYSTNT